MKLQQKCRREGGQRLPAETSQNQAHQITFLISQAI
jgi:hypothetical protein